MRLERKRANYFRAQAERIIALEKALREARDGMLDIRNRVLCPVGPTPTLDELQEIASAELAKIDSVLKGED